MPVVVVCLAVDCKVLWYATTAELSGEWGWVGAGAGEGGRVDERCDYF